MPKLSSSGLLQPAAALLLLAFSSCAAPPPAVPTDNAPLLRLTGAQLGSPPVVIAYGDQRFTDPSEVNATNPKVRKWLVDRIAAEKPAAVLISGDIVWHGGEAHDYAVFAAETEPWRTAAITVLPALGNHELNGFDKHECLRNWWTAFPQLRGRRWYAAALGDRIYVLNVDSNSPLVPGSEQMKWFQGQLDALSAAVQFVLVNIHHPAMSDFQVNGDASHNLRPNEAAFADFLARSSAAQRVRFVVIGGHIHNYERNQRDGIIYLVSGGGGASPRPIVRTPDDAFQDNGVNYHYVKFTLLDDRLDAEMIRVADPEAATPAWEVKDRFSVLAPTPAK